MGGAVGDACRKTQSFMRGAGMGAPVIGILDSPVRLQELTDALEGYGAIYRVKAKASV
ncbi:MAG: hypothetical protein ACLTXL_11110 [Clostridia bacterium]